VGRNVRQLRERRGLSIRDLTATLAELLDKPFHPSGVVKIEKAERGVDADELVALALALGVTPNRLLLTDEIADDTVALTATVTASQVGAWWWATGEQRLPGLGVSDQQFGIENRPHDPPSTATVADVLAWEEAGVLDALRRGYASARAAGLSASAIDAVLALAERDRSRAELDDVDRQLRGDGLRIGTEKEGSRGER
jgi:transcriptional regulator with XRE-family HTH domain